MKLLTPITIKNKTFKNRVIMPPMCMYSVEKMDGIITDFHYTHYLTRAYAGVAGIIFESTGVLPNGRISYQDLGLWNDEQKEALKPLVKLIKDRGVITGIQLSHAGRKARVDEETWGPSALSFGKLKPPKEMDQKDIKMAITAFGKAAKRAHEVGFDLLEIHAAHGYLINEFMSNLSNHRTDEYKDKTLFLRQVILEIKKYWPEDKILQIRISADEYDEKGYKAKDLSKIINAVKDLGIDIINVSTGGVVYKKIEDYPGYQVEAAKIIKEETKIPTIAGGLINSAALGNEILEKENLDFIYFGRKLLREPYFLYKETNLELPKQYLRATIEKEGN